VEQQMSDPHVADGYEVVARYHAEDDASRDAEALLMRGTGAIVERQPHDAPFALLVVAGGAARAREALGLAAAPAADTAVTTEKRARPQVVWIALIFLAAMVLLPIVGFLVSFKLSGG
jgi:hypothetical protein